MRISETAEVLTKIAAYDRRKLGDADVTAWHAVIGMLDRDDAMEAVERWYAEETEWMMPAHLRRIVRKIVHEREVAASATGWAPGQAGVPADQAMPAVTAPIQVYEIPGPVLDLLAQVRAILPEGSKEALMPRRMAWEREHAAYRRAQGAEPNPHYRPNSKLASTATQEALRRFCRENGPHDDGMHIETCPDAAVGE